VASSAAPSLLRTLSTDKFPFGQVSPSIYSPSEGSSGGILEQAWMTKMAKEIARKVKEEQDKDKVEQQRQSTPNSSKIREVNEGRRLDGLPDAPPAYAA